MEQDMKIMQNEQLDLAFEFVQYTDKNVFLTGKAGTGKTTFLHNLRQVTLKRMAIVAPTGVAAINAGGVTIHSFFQMPFGPYISQSVARNPNEASENSQKNRKFNREKINLLQGLDLLVIDEISMVRADMLDGIDEILRRYRDRSKPFGGVQLLMIGDLHQLSPVVKDDDWRILREFYPNLYFFNSKALLNTLPVSIELKHIYRQSDTHFIDLLNCIRENKIDQHILDQLNQRYIPNFKPDDEEGYITLTTHNQTANEINLVKLAEIDKPSHNFMAIVQGDFPEYSYPTVVDLEIKVGSQVMFVKNDPSRDRLYYNGKIGKVVKITKEAIHVKCPGDLMELAVHQAEWQNIKYELNAKSKEIDEAMVGSFTQYPLKLAWAITIHKSQGLTFEKAIIDANAAFAHGQVYVALSRCKSFEGMVLRSPISFNSVKTDGTVSEYTKNSDLNAPGEQHLKESKVKFQQSLLHELFDFNEIKSKFFKCVRVAEDNYNLLAASVTTDLDAIRTKSEKEVYSVAETFKRHLNQLLTVNSLPEENSELQERIKKACVYFEGKISEIIERPVNEINLEADNRAVKKTLNEAFDGLKKSVFVKQSAIKLCVTGFDTISYLKTKSNAEIDYGNSISSDRSVKIVSPQNISHPELYLQIKKWRDNLAAENNTPVYLVLPQKALTELVELLPSTLSELETIKGIGKIKVKQYGKELLEMINTFCEKNNVQQTPITVSVKPKVEKTETKLLSFDMFKLGKSISEIAIERGFTEGTIQGHLAHFISTGEIDIFQVISKEKVNKIIDYINQNKPESMNDTKAAMGDSISYNDIRAVMIHMEFMATSV